MRSDRAEITTFLRYAADLQFALYEVTCDKAQQARGYAYAKAADAVETTQQSVLDAHIARYEITPRAVKFAGSIRNVGQSITLVITDFIRYGGCQQVTETEKRLNIQLTPELNEVAQLKGMGVPFVFTLARRFGISDKATLLEQLPQIRKQDNAVFMRAYRALLIDVQNDVLQTRISVTQLADDLKLAEQCTLAQDKLQTSQLSMGCSVPAAPPCALCKPCEHVEKLK